MCNHCGYSLGGHMRGQWPCICCKSNPAWGDVCERDYYKPGIILKKGEEDNYVTHLHDRGHSW